MKALHLRTTERYRSYRGSSALDEPTLVHAAR